MKSSADLVAATLLVLPRTGTVYADSVRRHVRYGIKQGRSKVLEHVVARLQDHADSEPIQRVLGQPCTLVPMPGHAPLVKSGLWVARELCEVMIANGIGTEIAACVRRKHAVAHSSMISTGSERPSPDEHYESLELKSAMPGERVVVLVDDVVTRGATMLGARRHLAEVWPGSEILGFAFFATGSKIAEEASDVVVPTLWRIGIDPVDGRPVRRPV